MSCHLKNIRISFVFDVLTSVNIKRTNAAFVPTLFHFITHLPGTFIQFHRQTQAIESRLYKFEIVTGLTPEEADFN